METVDDFHLVRNLRKYEIKEYFVA